MPRIRGLSLVSDDQPEKLSQDEVNKLFNDNRTELRENIVDGTVIGPSVRKFLIGKRLSLVNLKHIASELDRNIEHLTKARNFLERVIKHAQEAEYDR